MLGEEVEQLHFQGVQWGSPFPTPVQAWSLMVKQVGSMGSPLFKVSPSLSSPVLGSQYRPHAAATAQRQDLCCPSAANLHWGR